MAKSQGHDPDLARRFAAQVGATAALQVGRAYCADYVAELGSVRDIVVHELSALAPLASVPAADGAFYVLLRVDTGMQPLAIAERLIREHKVAGHSRRTHSA
jgi:aspartate/methionine/tyrosine aminotransferase